MKVLSLFSGCGGLDLGFKKAGATIIWANDIDKEACLSYRRNIGNEIVHADISEITPELNTEIDVVMGGFPCLGFTVAKGKTRSVDSSYNRLYLEYIKVLKKIMPKYFLVENVPGMKSGEDFKSFFDQMLVDFENVGYRLEHQILSADEFGVPQKRKRLIIIGTRLDCKISPEFPTPFLANKEKITLHDAISDLPEDYSLNIPNHDGGKHKVKINGYVGNRLLDWNSPSPTITGRGSRTGGAVIHPHPNLKRRLSVRECARIQSFPDDFIFEGSNGAGFAQVGNAVPPIFSFFIAKEFIKIIDNKIIHFNSNEWNLPYSQKLNFLIKNDNYALQNSLLDF